MKRMFFGSLILALAFGAALADDGAAVSGGRAAAKSWLESVDAGEYARSWDESSSAMRAAVTRADWEKGVRAARGPLGKVKSRTEKSATFKTSLPGAPDGEYVVLMFESSMENKQSAVETVAMMHEKDGSWKVAGYFIR